VRPPALRRFRALFARLALLAGIWAVVFLLFAAQLVFTAQFAWTDALRLSALNWLPWLVLTPAVLWLTGRFPFESGQLWRSIPVHLAACAACFALTNVATELLFQRNNTSDLPLVSREISPGAMHPGPRDLPLGERPDISRGGPPPDFFRGGERRDFSLGDMPGNRGGPGGRGGRGGPDGLGSPRGPMARPGFGPPPFRAMFSHANLSIPIYLLIACAAQAAAYYRRAQERDRQALVLVAGLNQAKLDALRLQLQPHFLFNTLNAISTLVHRDANAADELIGDLSELLRLSLQTAAHEVPLSRELEFLDCYLAIEQARLGDRLRIVRDIDPAATDACVPTLLLQPLAENAIRHGLEPRSAPGTLTVRAHREGDTLRLSVADDGIGLASANQRGIGLTNSEQRLRALHGAAARLELLAPPEGGVRVEITLPYHTQPRQMSAPA
jgi:hypothetical protein